jgi:RNA polymerase sigma-70 factor, ECF subfamily
VTALKPRLTVIRSPDEVGDSASRPSADERELAMADRDDDQLMVLAAAGRKDSFELLVRRHLHPVAGYCAKYTGSPTTGDELAQEVMVRLWSDRQNYRPMGKFKLYLFTLAKNACRNHVRFFSRWFSPKDQPEVGHDHLAQSGAEETSALDNLIDLEKQRRVHALVRSLSPKLREAVLLRFDQGLSYAQIGAVIGKPEATARTRVFNALRKLREEAGGAHP